MAEPGAPTLNDDLKARLLDVVRRAIEAGVAGRSYQPDPGAFPSRLRRRQASFVTLTGPHGALRGCCGSLEPRDCLVEDLARNAGRTAFADPRFEPVQAEELSRLVAEIALLTAPAATDAADAAALVAQLEREPMGVLIEAAGRRATFLPKVWSSLPHPRDFVDQLLRKAGLVDYDGPLRAWTYTAETFSAPLVPRGGDAP